MEVPSKDEVENTASHLTSAAAFVEGGIQEACDDACSICLESFNENEPSTVTSCKHEFHLQCILEWCQRSSNCPMCWQPISLKDPSSQELLEAVEQERNFSFNRSRNSAIFRHPTLGDFELQHLPVGVNEAELEERILQHLAAAAAMGRGHHIPRREGQRRRSAAHGRPQFVVFSTQPNAPPAVGGGSEPTAITVASPSLSAGARDESQQHRSQFPSVQADQISSSSSRSVTLPRNFQRPTINDRQSSLPNRDRAGPSDFQSFSESLKHRFSSMSMKYKETISKSTRGWREKLFSRNTSMTDLGSEVRREVNAGIATVSRIMDRLETRENSRNDNALASPHVADPSDTEQHIQNHDTHRETPQNVSNTTVAPAGSPSN